MRSWCYLSRHLGAGGAVHRVALDYDVGRFIKIIHAPCAGTSRATLS
jgi:hypothetical protein